MNGNVAALLDAARTVWRAGDGSLHPGRAYVIRHITYHRSAAVQFAEQPTPDVTRHVLDIPTTLSPYDQWRARIITDCIARAMGDRAPMLAWLLSPPMYLGLLVAYTVDRYASPQAVVKRLVTAWYARDDDDD